MSILVTLFLGLVLVIAVTVWALGVLLCHVAGEVMKEFAQTVWTNRINIMANLVAAINRALNAARWIPSEAYGAFRRLSA